MSTEQDRCNKRNRGDQQEARDVGVGVGGGVEGGVVHWGCRWCWRWRCRWFWHWRCRWRW